MSRWFALIEAPLRRRVGGGALGSAFSIPPPEPEPPEPAGPFTLKVINGSGSGEYSEGAIVSIVASSMPWPYNVFSKWVVENNIWASNVLSVGSSSTSIKMPAEDVKVTAVFTLSFSRPEEAETFPGDSDAHIYIYSYFPPGPRLPSILRSLYSQFSSHSQYASKYVQVDDYLDYYKDSKVIKALILNSGIMPVFSNSKGLYATVFTSSIETGTGKEYVSDYLSGYRLGGNVLWGYDWDLYMESQVMGFYDTFNLTARRIMPQEKILEYVGYSQGPVVTAISGLYWSSYDGFYDYFMVNFVYDKKHIMIALVTLLSHPDASGVEGFFDFESKEATSTIESFVFVGTLAVFYILKSSVTGETALFYTRLLEGGDKAENARAIKMFSVPDVAMKKLILAWGNVFLTMENNDVYIIHTSSKTTGLFLGNTNIYEYATDPWDSARVHKSAVLSGHAILDVIYSGDGTNFLSEELIPGYAIITTSEGVFFMGVHVLYSDQRGENEVFNVIGYDFTLSPKKELDGGNFTLSMYTDSTVLALNHDTNTLMVRCTLLSSYIGVENETISSFYTRVKNGHWGTIEGVFYRMSTCSVGSDEDQMVMLVGVPPEEYTISVPRV